MTRSKILTMTAAMALTATTAVAGSDLEVAIDRGGERLTSDQIAELLIGKTVTAKSGDKMFHFYYRPDNELEGELVSGGWKGTGAFAITDADQVCVSMAADKGRYRCLTVVRNGETIQKFDAKGKMTFELLSFEPSTGL